MKKVTSEEYIGIKARTHGDREATLRKKLFILTLCSSIKGVI